MMKRIGSLSLLFSVLFILGLIVLFRFYVNHPIWKNTTNSSIVIHFEQRMNAKQLIRLIDKKQPIQCAWCLNFYFRFFAAPEKLQAGYYELSSNITPKQLVRKFMLGQVIQQRFTIREGQNSSEVMEQLNQLPYLMTDKQIEKKLTGICTFCSTKTDGMFLADTYFFPAGSKAVDILIRSHQVLVKKLDEVWQDRAPNLPFKHPAELLIAASIIEKETGLAQERKLIAAVIINRLRKGMRLQMDPTVIYALGDRYRYPLKKHDLRYKSPYNTYLHKGLPPAPIANVGIEALVAAAHPEQVDYLYFVAEHNGHHKFSTTLDEQINAINLIKRQSAH